MPEKRVRAHGQESAATAQPAGLAFNEFVVSAPEPRRAAEPLLEPLLELGLSGDPYPEASFSSPGPSGAGWPPPWEAAWPPAQGGGGGGSSPEYDPAWRTGEASRAGEPPQAPLPARAGEPAWPRAAARPPSRGPGGDGDGARE
jgi:hypothetical protein